VKNTDPCQPSRITETLAEIDTARTRKSARCAAKWMLASCGLWLVALGVYFIFLRPPLLPEDIRFIGSSRAEVQAALPGLAQ
jgi:hypothetical protein